MVKEKPSRAGVDLGNCHVQHWFLFPTFNSPDNLLRMTSLVNRRRKNGVLPFNRSTGKKFSHTLPGIYVNLIFSLGVCTRAT